MILEILILLIAIPVGIWIANHTKEELKSGKKYFRILVIASLLGVIGFWLYGFPVVSWTMAFIFIVSLISFMKS